MIAPLPVQPRRQERATLAAWVLPTALACSLVVTGASGLIYQVVWFRLLGTIFGVTVYATSAVLAAFMAGLALGSLLAAHLSDRLRRPLLGYGLAEVGIGLIGLGSLPLLESLQPLYRLLVLQWQEAVPLLATGRFVLAFLVLVVPTTLMGATLPLVVTGTAAVSPAVARNTGLLYAGNTSGAILGAFGAGFFLLGSVGLTGAVALAAAGNLAAGVVWVVLGSRVAAATSRPHLPASPTPTVLPAPERRVAGVVLASYAVSGGLALANEVIWTRVLAGIFPGTTYAFTVMLCTILGGIALGSWLVSPLVQRCANWALIYAGCQLALAATTLLSLVALASLWTFEGSLRQWLGATELLTEEPAFMALLALLALGPAATMMGVTFPVAARVYLATSTHVGDRVGRIYAANTLGAIAGSLLGGLVVVPLFGAERALWLTAGGSALLALVVLLVVPLAWRRRALLATAGGTVLLLVALLTPRLYERLDATDPRGEQTVWLREGADVTVRVARSPDQGLVLYLNSEGQASSHPTMANYHATLGLLGVLLHPAPREVLTIGLGGGVTAGAASLRQGVTVTVIELHEAVMEAARWFRPVNFGVLERENVRFVVDDGRNYLLLTDRRYDIILADIIRARNAGAANLYAVDYYRLARQALSDDGLMVQWVDDTVPEYTYRLLVRTFLDVFPESTLWFNGTLLVGSKRPFRLDPVQVNAAMQDPTVRPLLERLGLRDANDLFRELVAYPDELRAYVGQGPIITDRYPVVEFWRSLPSTGAPPDLRWLRLANVLAAYEHPEDGAVFSHPGVRWLVHRYHRPLAEEYQAPWPLAGQNAAVAAELQRLLERRARLWFIPGWQGDTDLFLERWLNTNAYRVLAQALGNTRLLLYSSPVGEPALQPFSAVFEQQLALDAVALDRTQLEPGEIVRVALDWRTLTPLTEDLKTSLRLKSEDGRLLAELSRQPRDQPAAGLGVGVRWRERSGLLIPPGTPPGVHRLEVSVYREEDGRPLAVTAGADERGQVLIGRLEVRPTRRTFRPEAVVAEHRAREPFGALLLVGFTGGFSTVRAGDLVPLTFFWQPQAKGASARWSLRLGTPEAPVVQEAGLTTAGEAEPGAILRQDLDFRVAASTPPGRYDLWLVDETRQLWLGRLEVRARTLPPPPPPPALAIGAPVGSFALLEGATVRPEAGQLEVTLVWRALAETTTPTTAFVQLLGPDGRLLAQSDQVPAGGAAPTTAWLVGERVEDRHRLRLPELPPGSRLIAGLYESRTLHRLPTVEGDAVTLPWPAAR
jgi:spermidine synthase